MSRRARTYLDGPLGHTVVAYVMIGQNAKSNKCTYIGAIHGRFFNPFIASVTLSNHCSMCYGHRYHARKTITPTEWKWGTAHRYQLYKFYYLKLKFYHRSTVCFSDVEVEGENRRGRGWRGDEIFQQQTIGASENPFRERRCDQSTESED